MSAHAIELLVEMIPCALAGIAVWRLIDIRAQHVHRLLCKLNGGRVA